MFPKQEAWGIVVLGAWNPSIFSSEWIMENLSNDRNTKVEIAFNLTDPTAPRKITFDEIVLYPGRKQIFITPIESTIKGMENCSQKLAKIFSLLHHTPIGHMGINFSFVDEEDNVAELNSLESITDNYRVVESSFNKTLQKDRADFMLKYTLEKTSEGCQISFNFHYEISDVNFYLRLFEDRIILEHYKEALEFADKNYNFKLEST